MNIEEADPAAALSAAAPYLGHVQVSDSNRLQPGAGHLDWPLFGAALQGLRLRRADSPSRAGCPAPPTRSLPAVPPCCGRYL